MRVGTEKQSNGENNNIYNNKRHACGVCEWWMKIIILLIIRGMHVECVSGWMVCIYLYIYYNDSCVSVMVVVFGKYESGKMNYV